MPTAEMSTTQMSTAQASAVRASDAEREDAVRRIHDALGEGRLDYTEAEERSSAAAAAKDRTELAPLLADLPPASPSARLDDGDVPTWTAIGQALAWRAHLIVRGPGSGRPTPRQTRTAAVLAVAAVVLFLVCAVLGALAVGA